MQRPAPILSGRLDALSPAFVHGFFTRDGGVSTGIYRGLNVGAGSNDSPGDIRENRRRVSEWMGAPDDFLATPHQIHSPDAEIVRDPWAEGQRPKADAVVTDRPGIVIGVLTADCGPVLFADADAGVIGAAHAGWKGAIGGVLENTIAAMESLGATRAGIRAALGPSISQKNYEVGPDFVERLAQIASDHGEFLRPSPREGHSMFDLPGFILRRLEMAGIQAEWTGQCTYADENRLYSYRRTTHRGEPDYGRQISAIMMRS